MAKNDVRSFINELKFLNTRKQCVLLLGNNPVSSMTHPLRIRVFFLEQHSYIIQHYSL